MALCPHCGNPIDITISVSIQQADANARAQNPVQAAFANAFPSDAGIEKSGPLPLTQKQLLARLQAVIPEREYWQLTELNHRLSRYAKAREIKSALKILEANGQIDIETLMNRQIIRWRPQGAALSEAQKAALLARAAQFAGIIDAEFDEQSGGYDNVEEQDQATTTEGSEEAEFGWFREVEDEENASNRSRKVEDEEERLTVSTGEPLDLFNAFDLIAKEAESGGSWDEDENEDGSNKSKK